MKNPIKIAFFDIDGTLASNRNPAKKIYDRIPDSAKKTIRLLKERQIIPVIATGRGKAFISGFVEEIGIDSYICANGLCMAHQGKIIYEQFLQENMIAGILPQLMALDGITFFLETATENYLYKDEFIKEQQKHQKFYSLNDSIPMNAYQLVAIGDHIKERVKLQDKNMKAIMVAPNVINILPSTVSKASGIEQMLSLLNLDKINAIAFGDEENDIEMFGAVGCAVAMGNGAEKVKEIADYVTTHVDEDGIYNACRHFNLVID